MKDKRQIYLGLIYFCLIVAMLSIVMIVWGNV
jgi:hypothetical protein